MANYPLLTICKVTVSTAVENSIGGRADMSLRGFLKRSMTLVVGGDKTGSSSGRGQQ